MHDIPKQYDPASVEKRILALWLDGKAFAARTDQPGPRFSIVIPPPNITGALHMGHALNNGIQDIAVRYQRMQGKVTVWIPGTDHAGIATQNVVERDLTKEGVTRAQLGRERFIEKVWEWKHTYGNRIIHQLQRLGCSCDWDRLRFTLDSGLSRAVREVFVRLYEKGLIYRGKYIVNWCPRCRTAISDEEVDHQETDGHLWFIKYPVKGSSETITVATTRPETMLGDTAVAVHPDDGRYRSLIGATVILPLAGREIPVVGSSAVDPEFGTGAVKVTPAHDPADFHIAAELGLPAVIVMAEDGTMTAAAGSQFAGMDRFRCRELVIEHLKAEKRIGKIEKYSHSVGHCQRCNTIIEPYLSDQWFVRMKPLAEPALAALDAGQPALLPKRWVAVYRAWLENIRDWCISRQLWWGHRIPVWYCDECGAVVVEKEDPTYCPKCEGALRQDEDVLDTWFSSWLWPFSTMGWPETTAEYQRFFPTDLLVTAYDIIFFWVARMVMASLEFTGQIPFTHVYFTGMVKDELGRWMSKSLGNGIDPIEMIDKYSADAVRFSLAMLTTEGQDVNLAPSKFEMGRNFSNKIWNAYRLLALNEAVCPDVEAKMTRLRSSGELDLSDRWILSRAMRATVEIADCLDRYRFNDAALAAYNFVWRDYCDWYLELIKSRLSGKASEGSVARCVATYVWSVAIRMLHPFMPFITEELWQRCFAGRGMAMHSRWPAANPLYRDEQAEADMELLQGIIRAIRTIRGEMNVPPGKLAPVIVKTESPEVRACLERNLRYVQELARVSALRIAPGFTREEPAACTVVGVSEVFLPLEGLVDIQAERGRLQKDLDRTEQSLRRARQKLGNSDFLERAPREVVEAERTRAEEVEARRDKLLSYLEALS
ncbi:valine--tRNA ligase [Candidatus Fermentibacteria bacterium]|nr:valine--tRNA ligase [Candidatus Fermentibacteria bacterium]